MQLESVLKVVDFARNSWHLSPKPLLLRSSAANSIATMETKNYRSEKIAEFFDQGVTLLDPLLLQIKSCDAEGVAQR